MFHFLPKSRKKSALTSVRAKRATRRRLFESLETRRVFDADGAAVDTYINFDLFGGSNEGAYVTGDTVAVDAGLLVTSNDGATVEIALYADTGNPGTFDFDDSDGNEIVTETGTKILIQSYSLPAGQFDVSQLAFAAPAAGSYWVVLTATDGTNSAVEYFGFPLEVTGTVVELPTVDVSGPLVPGSVVDFTVSDANASGTWLVTFDSNNDGSYETSFGDHPGSATDTFTPPSVGNYLVQFETSAGISSTEFTVSANSLGSDGVYSIGTDAAGSNVVLTTLPTGATSVAVYGQGGNDVVLIAPSITVPVTVYGGAGNDIIVSGGGNDILVGGVGNDIIAGGAGRDLIVGGDGTDLLIGNAQDDILISGIAHLTNAELAGILATWSGAGSFSVRIADLLSTSALNPALNNVLDDDDVDLLSGNAGSDWIFANLVRDGITDGRDIILDLTSTERALYEELE